MKVSTWVILGSVFSQLAVAQTSGLESSLLSAMVNPKTLREIIRTIDQEAVVDVRGYKSVSETLEVNPADKAACLGTAKRIRQWEGTNETANWVMSQCGTNEASFKMTVVRQLSAEERETGFRVAKSTNEVLFSSANHPVFSGPSATEKAPGLIAFGNDQARIFIDFEKGPTAYQGIPGAKTSIGIGLYFQQIN